MRSILEKLRSSYSTFHIICGFDVNTYLEKEALPKFEIFPDCASKCTVNKRRTNLQTQINKAEMSDRMAKDFLFSTTPLMSPKITTINGTEALNQEHNIPSSDHPYDHFLVSATIFR